MIADVITLLRTGATHRPGKDDACSSGSHVGAGGGNGLDEAWDLNFESEWDFVEETYTVKNEPNHEPPPMKRPRQAEPPRAPTMQPPLFKHNAPRPMMAPSPIEVPSLSRKELGQFQETLVSLSIGALAIVDPNTGAVHWSNPSFKALMQRLGSGDSQSALVYLWGRFCRAPTHYPQYSNENVTLGKMDVGLVSATLLVTSEQKNTVLLWSLHTTQSAIAQPDNETYNRSWQQQPSTQTQSLFSKHFAPSTLSSGLTYPHGPPPPPPNLHHQVGMMPPNPARIPIAPSWPVLSTCNASTSEPQQDPPFPDSADFSDHQTKIINYPQNGGNGKPQVQLLWRKYGQRIVASSPNGALSPPSGQQQQRMYFKCYDKSCPARLRFDVDMVSADIISRVPTGKHNHYIQTVKPTENASDPDVAIDIDVDVDLDGYEDQCLSFGS
eukprot:TRINITY_DN686_c0_g2_i5.p1 TRINITY_DN686_c0_g2~~TRINITY_DN686_c0_g2_i5.p1  ORF type:complete len:439 (+),score=24.14 TRINITY_DN686_c0_g2_i5:154-1470(+)